MMLRRYHEEKTDQKQGVTKLEDVTPKKEEAPKKATRKKATDKG